jgi:hypothetical protein
MLVQLRAATAAMARQRATMGRVLAVAPSPLARSARAYCTTHAAGWARHSPTYTVM